jgi:single-strand DNA-binding protein
MINKVILVGNVGSEPKIDLIGEGTKKASFSLATSDRFKKNGEVQEETMWHNCIAWQGLAETIGSYVKKGSKLYIEGKIQHRKYDDAEGVTKYVTEIIVREMKFLDKKE